MIKEVSGNILETSAEAIVQGIAPFDHFNQGLALSLKEEWPAMAQDFRHYCHLTNPDPGTVWIWSGPGGKRIINLLTQDPSEGEKHSGHPGKASLSNIRHCLKNLSELTQKENIGTIALPKIGCGPGGLDWEDVRPLIYQYLEKSTADVFLYTHYRRNSEKT